MGNDNKNATSEACQKEIVLIMLSVQQNEINTKIYSDVYIFYNQFTCRLNNQIFKLNIIFEIGVEFVAVFKHKNLSGLNTNGNPTYIYQDYIRTLTC
jgi:hypothetical protein